MSQRPDPRAARRRAMVLAATEPARTMMSAGTVAAALPMLRWAPRGDPHPVLVLPGLLASDVSTRVLRTWLGRLGYPVVGWSLGGIYARRLARRAPRQVRQVISLGSPFALTDRPVDGSPGIRAYERLAPGYGSRRPRASQGSLARPLPVPSTAVYSRWDGVVDWRACRQTPGPTSENVAVRSSHLGMGYDPAVLWVVADRLALPRDEWRPFQRPTRFGLGALFPAED